MVARADLETRAAECDSVEDFVALAREALTEPADTDYARELLQTAEGRCQFPIEFVQVAELLAGPIGEADGARELYEQAEDMCFDGSEFLAVGISLASVLGDKEKSRELINKGISDVKDPAEIIKLAAIAENVLEDPELASSLFAKIEGSCKSLEDYRALAEKVMVSGDADTARALYAKAERYLSDLASRVDYATGAKTVFGDTEMASKILGDLEGDCQFPAEFVALARGYKTILDDDSRIDDLLSQGAEFAMTGEEHLDLARGYFDLKGDREAAAASYRAALSDISDRGQLLEMAKSIAVDLDDRDLAKAVYAKAEGKITSPGDLVKLGLSVLEDTGDKDYVGEIFSRAEEKMGNALDFINLAGQIVDRLQDPDRAAKVYRKGLDKTQDYAGLSSLLDGVTHKLPQNPLISDILTKMEGTAETSAELIKLNDKVVQLAGDKDFGRRILLNAEDRVSSVNEMKAVVAAVARDHSEDSEWNARLGEKLAKREANQALYSDFQSREKQCETPKKTMALAGEIMNKLDDVFYARKLLGGVDEAFSAADSLDFSEYRKLIDVVDGQIGDSDWAAQLLDKVSRKFNDFTGIRQLVSTACALTDREKGRALAKGYLDNYTSSVPADAPISDWIKLARVRLEALSDTNGVVALINNMTEKAEGHFDLASLGKLAAEAGDSGLANSLYGKAAAACRSAAERLQLARRLRSYGIGEDLIRDLYGKGAGMGDALEQLNWAEGIIELFGDTDWARNVYDDIESQMDADEHKARYRASRKNRLERRL